MTTTKTNWHQYEKNWTTSFTNSPKTIFKVTGVTDSFNKSETLSLEPVDTQFSNWNEFAQYLHDSQDYCGLSNADVADEEFSGDRDDIDLLDDLTPKQLMKAIVNPKRENPWLFVEADNPLAVWLTSVREW